MLGKDPALKVGGRINSISLIFAEIFNLSMGILKIWWICVAMLQ